MSSLFFLYKDSLYTTRQLMSLFNKTGPTVPWYAKLRTVKTVEEAFNIPKH